MGTSKLGVTFRVHRSCVSPEGTEFDFAFFGHLSTVNCHRRGGTCFVVPNNYSSVNIST